jgi:hypothetical protein
VIRTDVHSAGETWPTHHTHPTLSPRMVLDHTYLTWSTHSDLSRSPHEVETGPYTWKKSWRPKTDCPAVVLGHLIHPPSRQPWSRRERFRASGYTLHRLTGPIYQHVINTFNTCSWGPTHRYLTDTGGGYNHLGAPPDLQLSNLNIASSKKWYETYRWTVVFWPPDIYQSLYLRLALTNIIQILARSSRVTQKVFIM